ncbi:MAG: insulinase family protein, partial [Planctomycetes bacterium]|nr:insulinase family protein [Planctomycetota bacterium]
NDDALPLEMLMSIVGGGESSRLYKDLVKEQKIAQYAVAGAFSLEDDGIAGAGAVIMPWGDKAKVMDAVKAQLDKVRSEPVIARELEKARNQLLSQEVTNSLTVASKARLLGEYEVLEGGADKLNKRLERIRAVTADDLLRVAKTYLAPERGTTTTVQPEIGSMLKSIFGSKEVDEGAEPVPPPKENRVAKRGGARSDLKRPDSFPKSPPIAPLLASVPKPETQEFTLSGGLRLVVVPNHEVPFVTMTLGVRNGGWTEEKPGTASMAAGMITKGSANHTAAELAEETEFNAIYLNGAASIDVASAFASCVTDKFDTAIKLLAEVVRTPKFPESELEILRQQELLGLMIEAKTPEYAADREMRKRLYGAHPYSRTATGEPSDVQGLKVDDLKNWWTTFVRPDTTVLYVAGDVEPATAKKMAEQSFGDWKAEGETPKPKPAEIPESSKTQIYLVDRPGSVQSQIRVGQRGITRQDPDYFRTVVFSQIFGGSFGSRLNKAIRVEKGLTYGARGGFSAQRFAGQLNISTFTKNPTTAETLKVILSEIDKIEAAPPESSELDIARSYLTGSFAGNRETPGQVVGDLWLIEYAGLPKDYLTKYLNGIKETSADDIRRVANRLIDKSKLTIVVVGEAGAVKSDLEKIAPVTVISPEGETTKEPAAKQPSPPS